jgi:hypothetical protein
VCVADKGRLSERENVSIIGGYRQLGVLKIPDWNARNRQLWEESQRLGPNPYYLEYLKRCCVVCKKEIPPGQGWYQKQSTGAKTHIACYKLQP